MTESTENTKHLYKFTLEISGEGETPEEAFAQALLNLSEDIDNNKIMLRSAEDPLDAV